MADRHTEGDSVRGTARMLLLVLGLFAVAMLLLVLVIVPGMADGAAVTPPPSAG